MHHLLYHSSATVPFDEAALQDLLVLSRRNNAEVGVTGMLLYDDGNFIQYLEGEEVDVQSVYSRIAADPRHDGVLILSESRVPDRVFVDWEMGFHAVTDEDRRLTGQFNLSRVALQARLGDNAPRILTTMMRQFYESTRRYAPA